MPKITRQERLEIATKRLASILKAQPVALARTLEQKISDAGPFGQRIQPHLLTEARHGLERQGRILKMTRQGVAWFHLDDTPARRRAAKLDELIPIYKALNTRAFTLRMGQALEIAVYRALLQQHALEPLGSFYDLDEHDDSTPYSREDPPRAIGTNSITGRRKLDFLVRHPNAGWAGIEVKNIREWVYPHQSIVKELILKCVELNVVPVLIARRIPFVTVKMLSRCGLIVHETFNQLLPDSERVIGEKAAHKDLLGFHDIRFGNEPDRRLLKFICTDLPNLLPEMRSRFDAARGTLRLYGEGNMTYKELLLALHNTTTIPPIDDEDDSDDSTQPE